MVRPEIQFGLFSRIVTLYIIANINKPKTINLDIILILNCFIAVVVPISMQVR